MKVAQEAIIGYSRNGQKQILCTRLSGATIFVRMFGLYQTGVRKSMGKIWDGNQPALPVVIKKKKRVTQ